MNFSETVQAYAYAALLAASEDQDDAIDALETILQGQYTTFSASNGRVMISASEANKTFTFSLPPGLDPENIFKVTFGAIKLLKSHTSDEVETLMFRRRRNVAQLGFC